VLRDPSSNTALAVAAALAPLSEIASLTTNGIRTSTCWSPRPSFGTQGALHFDKIDAPIDLGHSPLRVGKEVASVHQVINPHVLLFREICSQSLRLITPARRGSCLQNAKQLAAWIVSLLVKPMYDFPYHALRGSQLGQEIEERLC
jgi:hypothetical protein